MDYSDITMFGEPLSPNAAADLMQLIASTSSAKAEQEANAENTRRQQFEGELAEKWGDTLRALDGLRHYAFQYGSDVNERISADAKESDRDVSELEKAVVSLHARALQTASEIRALIASGHASGALARWRTLRELNVTSAFLIKHGEVIAERYRQHHWVNELEWFEGLERQVGQTVTVLTNERRQELQSRRAALIEKHGEVYGEPNGWAAPVFGITNPRTRITMKRLESDSGIEDIWQLVQSANDSVHAGYRHARFNPSRPFGREGFIHIAGASIWGLDLPVIQTARTLAFQTTMLWNVQPNHGSKPQFLLHAHVMAALAKRVGEAASREAVSLETTDLTTADMDQTTSDESNELTRNE